MGQHGHTTAPRSRPVLGLLASLVVGFVACQVLTPAPRTTTSDQQVQVASAAAAAPKLVVQPRATPVAATTPPTPTTRLTKPTDLPRQSGSGRRVVYSITHQRVWVVGPSGLVRRTYLVSGRLSQPSPGSYRVYSKSRWTASTVSAETMQYMVRFTHGTRTGSPIGFHSIPRDYRGHPAQSVKDLGKPLSAGCIRQRLSDAVFLWDFTHVGTRVVVIR